MVFELKKQVNRVPESLLKKIEWGAICLEIWRVGGDYSIQIDKLLMSDSDCLIASELYREAARWIRNRELQEEIERGGTEQ